MDAQRIPYEAWTEQRPLAKSTVRGLRFQSPSPPPQYEIIKIFPSIKNQMGLADHNYYCGLRIPYNHYKYL